MSRRPWIVLVAVVAGCGGGSAESPAEPPASVVEQVVTGTDAEARCVTLHSERFVREVYGSVEKCRSVEGEKRDSVLSGARAAPARAAGDGATARIELPSGRSGGIRLTRESGTWRVDRYDDDLLRALTADLVGGQVELTASRPGLDSTGAATCVDERVQAMAPEQVRGFARAAIGGGQAADATAEDVIAGCLADPRTGSGGRSYFRIHLEREIVTAVRDQRYDDEEIACVRRRLRSVTDREVLEHVMRDESSPPPATQHIAELVESCNG